ncbi:MAG: dockerin type I repeat-containing protein [Candidatus Glassbacteria bacterium]
MKSLQIMVLAIVLAAGPLAAEYTLVDHPRMFITKSTLPALAEQAYGNGQPARDYTLMKREADSFLLRGTLREPTSQWHTPYELLCCGICYLIERERGNAEAVKYAEAVKKYWGDGKILSNVGNGHFGFYSLVFDWIYDSLTAEERQKFGYPLGGWLRWYTTTPEIVLLYGDWLNNQTWGPAHLNIGNTRDGICPKLFVALALAGAGTEHDADCKQYLDSFDRRIPGECIPLFDQMGGVWSESYGHGSYGPTKVIAWAFEAWRTATGKDWFTLGSSTTYLKEINRWVLHLTVPFSNRTAYIDDNNGVPLISSWVESAPILAERYGDPVTEWVAESFDPGLWTDRWRYYPWQRLLRGDPGVSPRTPGQAAWPTARLFTGAGHVYMRSQWDDPDATWAFFGAGPRFAAHSRDDEGHFLIARKGWLVLRAGGEGHNDWDYYAGGSLPFNIVTIFDPQEAFLRTAPGAEALAAGGTKNERDGGLIRYVYGPGAGSAIARGEITAFKHDWRYTYAAANLTAGYLGTKVREVSRQFLYLRGEREFFVIFDRVEARNAAFPKTWFLHIPTEPQVDGSPAEIVAGHVYSYTDGNVCTWLSDPAGISQSEVLSQGKSRAFLKTLLPASFTLTKRGGQGYEYWGHPHEPTAQYNHASSAANQAPQAPWRLEVESGLRQERDYFLHVLEVADEGDTAMSSVSLLEPDSVLAGVKIVPAGGGKPVEVLFTRTGKMSAQVKWGIEQIEDLPEAVDTTLELGGRGDINRDGRVSILDAVSLLLLGTRNPGDSRCDFNNDGGYTISDAIELLRYLRQRAAWPVLAALDAGSVR